MPWRSERLWFDRFSYAITDGVETTVAQITVDIDGVNDDPIATNNEYSVLQGSDLSGNVIVEDTGDGVDADPDVDGFDPDDTFMVSEVNGVSDDVGQPITLPSGASLTLNADGTFTYNSADVRTDTFEYTIEDNNLGTSTATVTIRVGEAGNNNPIAVDDSMVTDRGVAVVIDVLANDSDPDNDPLFILNFMQGARGTVAIDDTEPTMRILYTPDPGFGGFDTFTYEVIDGRGGSATATVTVEVRPVNLDPMAVNDEFETDEDTLLSIDAAGGLLSNDIEPDVEDSPVRQRSRQ